MNDLTSVAINGALSGYATSILLDNPLCIVDKLKQLGLDIKNLNVSLSSLGNALVTPFCIFSLKNTLTSVLTLNPQGLSFLGSSIGYLAAGTPGAILGGMITSTALAIIEDTYVMEKNRQVKN